MASKPSRYRRQPEALAVDAKGRGRRSLEPRPLTRRPAALLHTLVEGERLDALAQAYYRQPRKWWQICDANPDFLSPLALIGQEPLMTAVFALAGPDPFPWANLLALLEATLGVEEILVADELTDAGPARAAWVRFNRLNATARELGEAIGAVPGVAVLGVSMVGRAGKQIAIPPDMPA